MAFQAPQGDGASLQLLRELWQDEGESAYLYERLADLEPQEPRRRLLRRLAEVERRHQAEYGGLLAEAGEEPGPFRPSPRARFLAWVAARGGAAAVMGLRIHDEAQEVRGYLTDGPAVSGELARRIAREEAGHADLLRECWAAGRSPGTAWPRVACFETWSMASTTA